MSSVIWAYFVCDVVGVGAAGDGGGGGHWHWWWVTRVVGGVGACGNMVQIGINI